jgi:hypothetical protein
MHEFQPVCREGLFVLEHKFIVGQTVELMPSSLRCDSGDIRVRLNAHSFVAAGALRRVQPDLRSDEAGFLNAFDADRDLIYKTAAKVHARGRKGSYELVTADF